MLMMSSFIKWSTDLDKLIEIAQHFAFGGEVREVHEYKSGNINDTYLVHSHAAAHPQAILQRINQNVFPDPMLIMRNLRTFLEHVHAHVPPIETRRWEIPRIIPLREGGDYFIDDTGDLWRALTFIEKAQTYPNIQDAGHAREVGYALGTFHRQTRDLDPDQLYDTLKGFHIMPLYLAHYDEVLPHTHVDLTEPEVAYCARVVENARVWAPVLENAHARGELSLRAVHGDPKVDNIMIDDMTGQAVSLIDLDTLKPGLLHYDTGDALRSGCNPLGEEPDDVSGVRFETDLCEAILSGYLPEVRGFLTPHDYAYLYDSIRVLAFEMGLRFFTDYLEGDVYFKVRDAYHNLLRAVVQFRLLESIESHKSDIEAIVSALT